jgi:hypothetical protein
VCLVPRVLALNAALAQSQSVVTRIDQNDPSVTCSGNWYSNSNARNTGGAAALTKAKGARAMITFIGSGIRRIGVVDEWAGLATVYLDGAMTAVDTYGGPASWPSLWMAPFSAASEASIGGRPCSIEATGTRSQSSKASWVWVDAFDVVQ